MVQSTKVNQSINLCSAKNIIPQV